MLCTFRDLFRNEGGKAEIVTIMAGFALIVESLAAIHQAWHGTVDLMGLGTGYAAIIGTVVALRFANGESNARTP